MCRPLRARSYVPPIQYVLSEDQHSELKDMFKVIDKDHSGEISIVELKKMFMGSAITGDTGITMEELQGAPRARAPTPPTPSTPPTPPTPQTRRRRSCSAISYLSCRANASRAPTAPPPWPPLPLSAVHPALPRQPAA